ncbi:MAG: hypothetical protein AAF092_14120 [Pseudomonadota bacterium]
MTGLKSPRLLPAAAAAVLASAPLPAQEGGVQLDFNVTSSLRGNDNPGFTDPAADSQIQWDNALRLNLSSETRTQILEAELGATVRSERSLNTTGTDIVAPTATLRYQVDSPETQFRANGSYLRDDVTGQVFVQSATSPSTVDLVNDDGERIDYDLGIGYTIGQTSPFTFSVDASFEATDFVNTADARLFDRHTASVSATARFQFTDITEATLTLSGSRFEAEDATSTTRDDMSAVLGVNNTFADGTSVGVNLTTRTIDDSVTGETTGTNLSLVASRPYARGDLGFSYAKDITIAGDRDDVEVTGTVEFPLGTLELGLGASAAGNSERETVGSLSYSREFTSGTFNAGLSRSLNVSDEASVQNTTSGSLGLDYTINDVSTFEFDLSYSDIANAGGVAANDQSSGTIGARYSREFNEDWNMSAGVERRYLEDATSAWSNSLFVSFSRDFSILP